MIVAYPCAGKSKKHYNLRYIQEYQYTLTLENGFWLKLKFQKYTYSCLGCFRNRIQDFPGCSITFQKKDWKGDQFFRYSRFSFTVMRKIFLDFFLFFFFWVRFIVCFFFGGGGSPSSPKFWTSPFCWTSLKFLYLVSILYKKLLKISYCKVY